MTRDDFRRIHELRKEISVALILWENAKESATRKTSVLTGLPKAHNASSQVERAIVLAETYHDKYIALNDELSDIYNRLKQESKFLTEQEAEILNMAYPQKMKTSEIAKKLSLTERHVYRLKKQALNKICR